MSKTLICNEQEGCEKQAAGVIADSIGELLKVQDSVVLAVPGGRSVAGIFEALRKEDIEWARVHIFMADERLVPLDNEESNFLLVQKHLTDSLVRAGKLPEQNVHPFRLDSHAHDKGLSDYEEEIKRFGGSYDIVLLSSGEDGHAGALYPNHHSFRDESEYFIRMDDSPKPPPKRMGMSRKMLLRAKVAIALFFGEAKMLAYSMFKEEAVSPEKCPVKLILKARESYIFTDIKEK